MKRSRNVITSSMRKTVPISAMATVVLISACSDDKREMKIYSSVSDCMDDNPSYSEQCKNAYQDAIKEAQKTAPKFQSRNDCAAEFGNENCVKTAQNNWFMPAMTGFLFAQALNNRPFYYQPMFSSSYPGSRYYGDWVSSDGYSYGRKSKRSTVYVPSRHLEKKPAVTKTISRGGFGSSVAAKSSWSRSKSRGWGG